MKAPTKYVINKKVNSAQNQQSTVTSIQSKK